MSSSRPRTFTAADGLTWGVEVRMPSASSAMVVFLNPAGRTHRLDRYAWQNVDAPEARNVRARLDPKTLLDKLTEPQLALLFRRSMAISAADNPLNIPITTAG